MMAGAQRFLLFLLLSAAIVAFGGKEAVAGDVPKPNAKQAAAKLDDLFQRAAPGKAAPAGKIDDLTFLRRLSLDLTGRLPDADTVRQFAADSTPDKRLKLIDRLLESDAYAVNWGRFWRDVVTNNTPASGNYLRWKSFDRWWVEK